MPFWRVLIVEDDLTYRLALEKYLRAEHEVTVVSTVRQAMQTTLSVGPFDFALVDLKLPDGSGFDVLKHFKKESPETVIIVMTAHGTVETAVRAVQRGAFHYLLKPFPLERLDQLVKEAQKQLNTARANTHILREKYAFDDIIGQSSPMLEVFQLIEKVSSSDSTILIRGESGTGKELVAHAIHAHSGRKNKPFITVNCGALHEELLESELFGHIKGAFTGATQSRRGRFEMAHEGTLFLDEVGDMTARLQVKLLRVLQEQAFEPLGSNQTVSVNVRIITATHRNLEDAICDGKFREDLYYRLNVIPIFLPPLRERQEDIFSLIKHFLMKFNQQKTRKVSGFSEEAMMILREYAWPGNVRELENLIERLVVLKGSGEIIVKDLPEKYFGQKIPESLSKWVLPEDGMDLNKMVEGMEEELIGQALQRTRGNRNQAARLLRLKRTTLVEKIKKKTKSLKPIF